MFLRAVLLPFAWTRLLLLWVAWFGGQMSSSWSYPFPEAARRGWSFLPGTALDAFGRWDAHWYLDVAARGYELRGALASVQSNLAFFPLYPWAVRGTHALLPSAWQGEGSLYLCAIALSNGAALLGLWLLWRLAREVTGDDDAASRTVLYALLFPTGFILSAAYPESLFLLLSVGALLAAMRGRFLLAGGLGLLLALTRPGGVLVAVPLAWLAFTQGGPRRGTALVASALPGLGLALHAAQLWRITGDPLALFHAQTA
ncbi:MAG: mannosyltransferase family protein, partial [Deltaproteobacteria bacterium]|nr:mannosyltransferase family protein [Deltaproteobacteria bacterium]